MTFGVDDPMQSASSSGGGAGGAFAPGANSFNHINLSLDPSTAPANLQALVDHVAALASISPRNSPP